MAPADESLEISSRSEYAIRGAKYHAFKNEVRGWRCPNGDLLKILSTLIKERIAPVHFIHIKKQQEQHNGHLQGAKDLAKAGTLLPRVNIPPLYSNLPKFSPLLRPAIDVEKVTADIPDDRLGDAPVKEPRKGYPDKHRGRDTLGAIRDKNRDKLLNAPSSGAFWNEVKRLADPKPDPIMVTAESPRTVFEKRLNPPIVLPTAFDQVQHKMNENLASMIPETTVDTTPERFFSAEWSEDDGAWAKSHLLDHSLDSA
ncbi:hypothetical protein K438DRAFT_1580669, partial [Mycena galopus ATCC 62051]